MTYTLKEDLIIPAGTVLGKAPWRTDRCGGGHYSTHVGLDYGYATITVTENQELEMDDLFDTVDLDK